MFNLQLAGDVQLAVDDDPDQLPREWEGTNSSPATSSFCSTPSGRTDLIERRAFILSCKEEYENISVRPGPVS